jgi:cytochrome c-type biogenesis protein CcmE
VVAIGGALVLFLTASISKGAEYYKHVDEVMTNIDGWRGKRLQVHGNVVDGSIEQAKGTLLYRFKIESRPPRPPAVITATYTGLVPDTFKSGAEVVAKGSLTADNQLDVVPDGIMAKCPSKYDADKEKKLQAKPGDVAQKL